MTPAEHATEAADLLAAAEGGGTISPFERDEVTAHAILAKAAGTGTHYTEADARLTQASAAKAAPYPARLSAYFRDVERALLHAHLAD